MFRECSDTLSAGDPAPDFTLKTAGGREWSSAAMRGRAYLLVFLRGTWCPNCQAQMQHLARDWSHFVSRDLPVLLVAAQKVDGLFGGRKFVEEHDYPFPILFDEDRSVTKAYGVFHRLGMPAFRIAHPSTFLIDSNGVVRWIAVSPTQSDRPSTRDLVEAIEACGIC